MADHVFAYGSLAAGGGIPAVLRGFRRRWGVAMDNRETIPGYKYYRAPDGSRPDVCVAYLDIEPANCHDAVDGVLLAVDDATLAALDTRERNYRRLDVTAKVALPPSALKAPGAARIWAYVGREESRLRLRTARAAGRAVIDAAYARRVARWAATSEPPDLPEVELVRVDVPGRPPDRPDAWPAEPAG